MPSDSDIDYSSDTSYTNHDILHATNIANASEKNSLVKKMYRKVLHHNIVNKKNDIDDESINICINQISFEPINNNNNTTFYNIERLSKTEFSIIYSILASSTYVIFVDNSKLIERTKSFFSRKSHLSDTQFPGCTFLPFESINMIKTNLTKLNNNVFNAELNGVTLQMSNDSTDNVTCYCIIFNEGEIIKNCLYKKMEITETIIFVPIDIYNLKQVEYKLRGFCQIAEELGAKQIDITFNNSDINAKKKSIDTHMKIKMIAGNLGLNTEALNTNDTNYNYNLTYPTNSMINLNEKIIKNKIKRKYFIVSDSIYRSNLELQYLIHSRCRHLIDQYSTVFSLDNSNTVDEIIYAKLKTHGINISGTISNNNFTKNNIQIITKVTFISLVESKDLINGYNVSMDEIGFNHIMETIRNSDKATNISDFKTKGIYKIISFINTFVAHVIKSQPKHYDTIHQILNIIKKEFTLEEYASTLCNYFSPNSQWIHFTNFIDLLGKRSNSYDKLGYIIVMHNTVPADSIQLILKFIHRICLQENIENNFWKMLQPYNMSLRNDLTKKLLSEYDCTNNNTWYTVNMLISLIKRYVVHFDPESTFEQLLNNMNIGYTYWEYYVNVIPFILQFAQKLYYNTSDRVYISSIFENNININSFIFDRINSVTDLTQYIEIKVGRIRDVTLLLYRRYPLDITDFCRILERNNYISKKLEHIIKALTVENIKLLLNLTEDEIIRSHISNFIYKLFSYNEQLNVNNLPLNYIGFEMVMCNYKNGIAKYEFNNTIIPFICMHFKNQTEINYIKSNYTMNEFNTCTSYDNMVECITAHVTTVF